jgi:hypothetical protein
MAEETVFSCSNIGLSGAQVFVNETPDGFEARQAVAFFGSYQMPENELEKIQYNPFHSDFHDNFASGSGATKEAAIEALRADAKSMADSLWL